MLIAYRYEKVTVVPECLEYVQDQIRRSHVFRNAYVAMRREMNTVRLRLLADVSADVRTKEALLEQVQLAFEAWKMRVAEYRKVARTKKLPVEYDEEKKHLTAVSRAAKAELSAARKAASNLVGKEMKCWINNRVNALYKEHVADGGMWYGTQGVLRRHLAKADRFKRWDGSGMLAMEVRGRALACMFETIESPHPKTVRKKDGQIVALPQPTSSAKPFVRISFSESPSTKPYIRCIFRMHRPLPDGAKIKWVQLLAERRGPHKEYAIILTIEVPDDPPAERGIAGLAHCWELRPDGSFRVAHWVGSDGERGNVVLFPATGHSSHRKKQWWQRMDRVDDQRTRRDNAFQEILLAIKPRRQGAPEWFRQATEHMHNWRSQGRLVRLLREWKDKRFDGDEDIFASCEAWQKQDRHRWCSQTGQSTATLRQRREVYRLLAADLRSRYGVVAIAPVRLKRTTDRRQSSDLPNEVARKAQQRQNRAAIGNMMQHLRNRCRVIEVGHAVGDTVEERAQRILASGMVQWKYGPSLADVIQ